MNNTCLTAGSEGKKSSTFVVQLDNISYLCNMEKVRSVVFYKNYVKDFLKTLSPKVKAKVIWTIRIIENLPIVQAEYLKHIEGTDGLYEIRVRYGSDIYRIFCFFDYGRLIILANGFQKKTQKTPRKEIDLALKIKQEYELEKLKNNGKQ